MGMDEDGGVHGHQHDSRPVDIDLFSAHHSAWLDDPANGQRSSLAQETSKCVILLGEGRS